MRFFEALIAGRRLLISLNASSQKKKGQGGCILMNANFCTSKLGNHRRGLNYQPLCGSTADDFTDKRENEFVFLRYGNARRSNQCSIRTEQR